MTQEIYYLGASDPEMDLIVELLQDLKLRFAFATVSGKRVHPGNAYEADDPDVPAGWNIVYVECGTKNNIVGDVIDHHRSGDPGFGLGPKDYWRASSIGQLVERLFVYLPPETLKKYRYAAAADHCFAQALQGHCPEIDSRRIASLSSFWRHIGLIATRTRHRLCDWRAIKSALCKAR